MKDIIYCDYVKRHGVYMIVWYLDDKLPKITSMSVAVGTVEATYERRVNGNFYHVTVRCRVRCYIPDYDYILSSIDNVMRRKRVAVKIWRRF